MPRVGMGLTTGALSMGELWAGGGIARLSPIFALIRFLEEKNIGRVLSAPNLTLKDGQTGTINVGGEIPLPAPAVGAVGAVAVGVTYRPYGIILEVTPQIKAPDLIELTVRAQVSELDWTNAITIMGTAVPGIRTREAQTVLQVRDGETIVIGGLISEEERRSVTKVPFLGDLPVIGRLFRRTEERRGQTVLVFFLTAHILE
ncbi:MAG TPA: type II and III secretion system protein [Armatimonadetes bacterium]|nr:type II and III secretion system protein [Armatimonadota bacterium]